MTIENLTSPSEPPEEILPLINNNYYSLPSKPHRLVSCDDLKFTVTPKFRFGFGKDSNVSQINGGKNACICIIVYGFKQMIITTMNLMFESFQLLLFSKNVYSDLYKIRLLSEITCLK